MTNTEPRKFQAILQLLQLVDALIPNKREQGADYGKSRKSFDYVDAITNLMVRDEEVVAAVTCVGQPIILAPTSENRAQVRPKYTSYVC